MGVIHVLDSELSNKIAAGEVVERPASVIKELAENSIDAGATSITVEIRDGGISYMRVADNGCGMKREDAEKAFLRHATSKIQTADDLDAIYTLGFRGEALSSIAAVAKADMYTKDPDSGEGIHVHAEGGEITLSDSAGVPDGTSVTVKGLFFNTPARMKFLKRDSTEAGYVADIISRLILAHPEISFKFINGKKEQLFSPGNSVLRDAVYTVYGRDYAKSVIDVDYTCNGIRVTGAVGKGEASRPNRSFQSFFVNRRYIKSPLIIRAVEEAYKNQIMVGKFPMAVLNIDVSPSDIDINVHPTKLEVKFSEEKRIYEAVYFGVKNALYRTVQIPEIKSETNTGMPPEQPRDSVAATAGYRNIPAKTSPSDSGHDKITEFTDKHSPRTEARREEDHYKPAEPVKKEKTEIYEKREAAVSPIPVEEPIHKALTRLGDGLGYMRQNRTSYETEGNAENELYSAIGANTDILGDYRIVGQIFETYIVAEHRNEMLIIDQHAAHERLRYEELKSRVESSTVTPQILLVPSVVSMTAVERSILEENKEFFEKIGFETEDFGENSVIVRTAPMEMGAEEISELIIELVTQLGGSKKELITEREDRALYTVACKSAVKANHSLSEDEMKQLLDAVFALSNINTCPHGRPIFVSMTKKKLEKDFKRIV